MPVKDFLTVRERLLLHLTGFKPDTTEFKFFPQELTQGGIAKAIFIHGKHVGRGIKPLLEEGLAVEELRSTVGGKQKQKVCYLSEKGRFSGKITYSSSHFPYRG